MRNFGKWLGRILLVLILAGAAIGIWKREEITRLMAVNSLFSEDKIVANFSNMEGAFLTRELPRGTGPTSGLPHGAEYDLPAGTDQWIKDRSVTSLLVLKDGKIRYENYFQGTSADDRRISWSVAKSYLSALTGILVNEGVITSLDDPVIKYVPDLKGTAYHNATLRNVLNMASGVTFDEDYFDPKSDINRMGREIALGGTLDDFASSFTESFAQPGETWQYVSIDTHVIGWVLREATGKSISELLTDKILVPLGLERDGYYVTDGEGVAFVLGGLNFTTRDFARFGQMFAQNGEWQGKQIVPADWIAESTAPSAPTAEGKIGYGYQWWVPVGSKPGQFMARGVYGQFIYIDQPAGVVIVSTAADRQFRAEGAWDSVMTTYRAIVDSLE